MHLLLFCTMTNKCTIISQITTFLHASTLSCHSQGASTAYLAKLRKHFKYSCWQYNVKHLNSKLYYQQLHLKYLCNWARYWLQAPWGWHDIVETCKSVIICEIIVHLSVIVQKKSILLALLLSWSPLGYYLWLLQWGDVWGTERSERRGGFSPRNRYARHCNAGPNTDNLRVSSQEETDRTKPLSLHGDSVFARVSPRKTLAYLGNKLRGSQHQILFSRKTSTITSEIMSLLTKIIPYDRAKLGHT